jgi:hypothetical protein
MLVIFSIYNKADLLPYFLRYYSSLGAIQFACGLHNGKKSPLYEMIAGFKSTYDLEIRSSLNCRGIWYRGDKILHVLNSFREDLARRHGWYCIADLDEFYYFHGNNFSAVVRKAKRRGLGAVHGVFFDRIASDGSFPAIGGSLDETFPLACDLTARFGFLCDKIAVARSNVPITSGHHKARAKLWRHGVEVHHFKWSKGIDNVVRDSYVRAKTQGRSWSARHYPKMMNFVRKRLNLLAPRLNVRPAAKLGI